MLFDLHVHTEISPCSSLSLAEILAAARSRRLDGVCLTDHDTMNIRHRVQEGRQPDGLIIIIGMEYATTQGDFLLFGPFEDLKPGLSATEVLGIVNRQGGAAIGAHPYRPGRGLDETILAGGLCGVVETHNGRTPESMNHQAEEMAEHYGLPATGGSDAHTLDELGRFLTRFLAPVRSRADLIAALAAGLCQPHIPDPTDLHPPRRLSNCTVERYRKSSLKSF